MTKPPLTNPYTSVPREAKTRLNADVSHLDWNLIKSVCPMHGIASTICSLLIHTLANECRTRNWTIADVNSFISLVRDTIGSATVRGRTPHQPDGERPLQHDGRGVEQVRPPATSNPSVEPDSGRVETPPKTAKRGKRTKTPIKS